jgi:acetylglutamate kinase
VGEVEEVNPHVIATLVAGGYIPVICSIAVGRQGETFNINADHIAGRLAGELGAEKLVLLTDVRGILADVKDPDSLLTEITMAQAGALVSEKKVDRGMIPKVEACLMALERGVPRAHILDGRVPHSLLVELFTDQGVSTMVVP